MSTISATGSALGPQDDRPLTEQEFQLLQRLLSDPFSIPLAFKTWLVSYLSGSDLTLPISAVLGLTNLLGITGAGTGSLGILPAGIILPYGGPAAPTGSKMCDGASYSRAIEKRLFDAIGTSYGAADGAHFNVPDILGRTLVGVGSHADVNLLNRNDGLPVSQRRPKHQHSPHTHNISLLTWYANTFTPPGFATPGALAGQDGRNSYYDEAHQTAGANGGVADASAPMDAPAFVTTNFIIIA